MEWLYLWLAWWSLLWYFLYLKWGSFDRLVISSKPEIQNADAIPFTQLTQRLHRLVELASRLHFLSMTCLPRALTLQRLLVWRGIPSHLRIGVAQLPAGVLAHAWVEVADVPVGEAEDVAKKFNVLEHIPSHPSYKFTL